MSEYESGLRARILASYPGGQSCGQMDQEPRPAGGSTLRLTGSELVLVDRIRAYFRGEIIRDWGIPLYLAGASPFQISVWKATATIPYGETRTYGQIALQCQRPNGARAVGQALKRNPVPLIIPCHRVIGQTGTGGFSGNGGVEMKAALLLLEQAVAGLSSSNTAFDTQELPIILRGRP